MFNKVHSTSYTRGYVPYQPSSAAASLGPSVRVEAYVVLLHNGGDASPYATSMALYQTSFLHSNYKIHDPRDECCEYSDRRDRCVYARAKALHVRSQHGEFLIEPVHDHAVITTLMFDVLHSLL